MKSSMGQDAPYIKKDDKISVIMDPDTDNSRVEEFTIPKARKRQIDDFCSECVCNARCEDCVLTLIGESKKNDE